MSRPERAVVADNEVQELVAKARKAQATYENFSQEQVDAIVRDMAKYVYDNAEALARMAVDETGIGNYEDKVLKKKGKARVIWNNLKGKKSRGVIGEDPELRRQVVQAARKDGVSADGREVAAALREFDELWDVLEPAEKNRVLRLLIERVDVDVPGGTVDVAFRPAGVKQFAQEFVAAS